MPEPTGGWKGVEKKGLGGRNINISYCVQTYSRSGNKLEILAVILVQIKATAEYMYIFDAIYLALDVFRSLDEKYKDIYIVK